MRRIAIKVKSMINSGRQRFRLQAQRSGLTMKQLCLTSVPSLALWRARDVHKITYLPVARNDLIEAVSYLTEILDASKAASDLLAEL